MASLKGKKVLVTGGLGFIGGFVTELLLKKGALVSVTATARKPDHRALDFISKVKVIRGDLRDRDFALKALRGQDVIFHLAALKVNAAFYDEHPAKVLRDNMLMTTAFFDAVVARAPEKVIVSSSVRAAAPPALPRGSYGWAKKMEEIFAEGCALEFGIPTTVVKLPNTFGPRDDFGPGAQVVPSLIRRVIEGEDPLMLASPAGTKVQFIPVRAAAEALVRAASGQDVFNAVDVPGEEVSVRALAEEIASISGLKPRILFRDGGSEEASGAIPAEFRKALAETVRWYKNSTRA